MVWSPPHIMQVIFSSYGRVYQGAGFELFNASTIVLVNLVIGRPYFYTRKSPNFAFSSYFFISIYLYLRSRDIGIAYTDAPDDIGRALAEAPRRFTKSFRAYPRFPLSFTFPPRSAEHHRGRAPNYQNSSEIVAQPRRPSDLQSTHRIIV